MPNKHIEKKILYNFKLLFDLQLKGLQRGNSLFPLRVNFVEVDFERKTKKKNIEIVKFKSLLHFQWSEQ